MGKSSAEKKKENHRKKKVDYINKKGVKEKFAEMLELPKELVLDRPKLTMVGNFDIMIENYKGIIEYSPEHLRVKTGAGILKLSGSGLLIREITSEDIIISGIIDMLEFVGAG